MENPIKSIVAFNKKAGLLDDGHDDAFESSMIIEEALEGYDLVDLAEMLDSDDCTPKGMSRKIIDIAENCQSSMYPNVITEVQSLDKAVDQFIFAVGSMAKLGLSPQQITQAVNIVMKANNTKLGQPKDSRGKLMKPENFVGPEPELQALLDRRGE